MTLPLVDFVAFALVANILAFALALPADLRASALTFFTFWCSYAATPLAFAPLVFDFCSAATVTMGTSHLFRPLTHIAAYDLLA